MIKYSEILPDVDLRLYIDTYWTVETSSIYQPACRRIFPNGCVDLWINMGSTTPGLNSIPLKPGVIYLGATMTSTNFLDSIPNCNFIGIHFKPGGFSAFYKLPLNEIADQIIEFPDRNLFTLLDMDDQVSGRLDHFFKSKIRNSRVITSITETVDRYKGNITVDLLADKHCVSNRTIERLFKENTGITPKEFIKVIRFQHVLKRLRKNQPTEVLSHLAFEMGYYDHAHLTNEIKKYSGLNPTELALMLHYF